MDVRTCARCGNPTAIPCRDWGRSMLWGLVQTRATGRTDFVCQHCGALFTLHPRATLRAVVSAVIAGSLLFIAAIMVVGGIAMAMDGALGGLGLTAGGLIQIVLSVAALVYFWRPA